MDQSDVIIPKKFPGFQDARDIPAEVYEQQQIRYEETDPSGVKIILGPCLEQGPGLHALISLVEQLKLGHIKGMAASMTFHMSDGTCVDITVHKPYLLRSYQKGDIVKVYACC